MGRHNQVESKMGGHIRGSETFRHQPFGRQYGVGHMGTKVSTEWVDQITDKFKEVSIFVVWLSRFAPFAK